MTNFQYQVLSIEDRSTLRMERVKALEADLFRYELSFEDALSDDEREEISGRIEMLMTKLAVHYKFLRELNDSEDTDVARS